MEDLLSSFQRSQAWDPSAVLRLTHISQKTQHHLRNTYATLAAGVMVSVLGVIAHLETGLGGILTGFGAASCLIALAGSRRAGNDHSTRLCLFGGFTFLKGASLGHLVQHVLHVSPAILVTAFLLTVSVFACFSLAALYARRREYLYLGGILGSALSVMALASMANIFLRSQALFSLELYGGLALFCGYVVVDSQLIVEKSEAGDTDYIWAGAELYIDLVAIFVRICVILLQQQQKKEQSQDRKRRDRR